MVDLIGWQLELGTRTLRQCAAPLVPKLAPLFYQAACKLIDQNTSVAGAVQTNLDQVRPGRAEGNERVMRESVKREERGEGDERGEGRG